MIHDAIVLHHVAGRMRLRVPGAKGNSKILEEIRRALLPLEGVRDVATNSTIGTVVIDYDAARAAEFPRRLTDHVADRKILRLQRAFASNVETTTSITDESLEMLAEKVNQKVQNATGSTINLKELFPFSLVIYAVLFVDKAVNAAQWLNWLQFAFSSYMELHQDKPVAKVSASIEALRAEIANTHTETLETLSAQIAGLERTVRGLRQQMNKADE